MGIDVITIKGAREHNLKNVSITLPRNRLIVITGLSGSGKSSLAFDTIFAEGQRRYVESLSAYARQFLEQMHKPDVDHIEGLSPAIAIEQRSSGSNPRSIVATTTEIHDYLRLLFAHAGEIYCPSCDKKLERHNAEQIVEKLCALPAKTPVSILAPIVLNEKETLKKKLAIIQKQGFIRIRINSKLYELEAVPDFDEKDIKRLEIVVDRLVITSLIRTRLTDSVELALKEGKGEMIALVQDVAGNIRELFFSENYVCRDCGKTIAPLSPRNFSFNSPYGACPECGMRLEFDPELIIPDTNLSLADGAIRPWKRGGRRLIIYYNSLLRSIAKHYGFSMETPFKELPARIRKIILYGSGKEEIAFGFWRGGVWREYMKPFEGVIPNLARRYIETENSSTKETLQNYMTRKPCRVCNGTRLKAESLACKIGGKSIVDVCKMSIKELRIFFDRLPLTPHQMEIVKDVVKEIRARLRFLSDVGLDYLTLDRESGTLSGGEAQRIRLATQIGSGLVGVLYVLDEPSIGLHSRDNQRLIRTLKNLKNLGNTVVVVEHDEETIRNADYVVDMGPGAGRNGGNVIFAGNVSELLKSEKSLTGMYLRKELSIPVPRERALPSQHWLTIKGARANNLKNIDVSIPLGLMVAITGVSGSGKSTLIDEILRKALFKKLYDSKEKPGEHTAIIGIDKIDKAIVIDQTPIGRTPRSNPATYTGAFAIIRDLFAALPAAKARGYSPGRFSFNVKGGRCESCKGDGIKKIEMHFLPDVYVTCEQCRGKRYNSETLEVKYNGKNIAEVLEMTVDEALEFFARIPPLKQKLQTLSDVGLGYIQLGQSATTLSGGEAQRLKLSSELSKKPTGHTIYLLDEPTTGLHFADIEKLLNVLQRLKASGNTVVIIEHNMEVIKAVDYIIDLGPEGGDAGGRIVAAGTPEEVAKVEASYTGRFLRKILFPAEADVKDNQISNKEI